MTTRTSPSDAVPTKLDPDDDAVRTKTTSRTSSTSTLSEYLHNQFETLLAHSSVKHPSQKIEVVKRIADFIHQKELQPESKDEMFSPLIADVHLSIQSNGNSGLISHGERPNSANIMTSGIQLPAIDWYQQFRKGYSILMWVRFHEHSDSVSDVADASASAGASAHTGSPRRNSSNNHMSSSADPWADQMNPQPQILYRFASNASATALGIQATLHRDSSVTASASINKNTNPSSAPSNDQNQNNNHTIPCILRVESLRPASPSRIDSSSQSSSPHPNSMTTPISIPAGKWTLVGIQHSFPYMRSPVVSIAINGVEVDKGEVAYPSLVGEVGGIMRDNFILCNIPTDIDHNRNSERKQNRKHSLSHSQSHTHSSSRLNVDKVDFAGFGLFTEIVPALIQGIISEHGPSHNADGVIPVIPPVVQNRDAIVTNVERNAMQKKPHGGSGPFGLSSNRNKGGGSRGIGIPLSVGVMHSSGGNSQAEVLLQRLLSKLVIGLNASNAVQVGGGKVLIPVSMGCSVGLTADVSKVGIVQPKDPYLDTSLIAATTGGKKKNKKSFFAPLMDSQQDNLNMAKCGGNIRIFNSCQEFLIQQQRKGSTGSVAVPKYNLPSSLVPEARPIPSFCDAYSSSGSFGYILQAFHRSLPPPGYPHNLQSKFYQNSFDHLYDLVVYKGGAFAANLIELFAANISLGGKAKEEVLHSGGLHILSTLLRRVLLRAARLGMFGKKPAYMFGKKPEQDLPLWQVYGPREKSEDELMDMHATKQSAPNHIPALITKACCSVVNSCCGPVQEKGRRWKRPTLSLFIRRASDIALTAIFGFAMDMDLWGNDMCACASIMKEIVDRYCSEGFDSDNNAEIADKFDVGYGRMLRSEISVQHLLDNIRMRFSEEIILSQRSNSEICDAKQSVATSLSRLLYMLLKYSLSSQKSIPQGEHDVISAVNALSDCQLGSVGSHAILTAINDVLVFCETFPLNQAESAALPETDVQAISAVLYSHHYSNSKQKSRDACFKLKAMKTDIIGRLARNLIIGQFHNVLAPLLLSRTIFTGNAESTSNSKNDVLDGNHSRYHWQSHWRLVLRLFTVSSN
jgi:hypothetical protein